MKGMGEKHCCKDDLLLYYYGELSRQRSRELADHLRGCSSCREEWRRLQRTLDGVGRPAIELAPCEAGRFAARVAARAQKRGRGRLWLWGGAVTAMAVLALSLVSRPPGILPGRDNQLVADAAIVQELDLLQNMELLEELDMLQEFEGQG